MSRPIHQELRFDAGPERVYNALMDSEQHTLVTGRSAEIGSAEGNPFTAHDGAITGRNIELKKNERIVQAWRVAQWDPGVYSVVHIELSGDGDSTILTLDHDGFPEPAREHLDGGWHQMYWKPLKKYLAR